MSDAGPAFATEQEFDAAFSRVFETQERDAATTLGWIESPVGPLLVGASLTALQLLHFTHAGEVEQQLRRIRTHHFVATRAANPVISALRTQLAEYFAARRQAFDVPLDFAGSTFQTRVWSTLLQIPYGQTWSYLDVALRLEDREATRAVGMANGANPIAIVIPCHRVINANGALGGYGGGLWRKQVLLDLENGQGRLL